MFSDSQGHRSFNTKYSMEITGIWMEQARVVGELINEYEEGQYVAAKTFSPDACREEDIPVLLSQDEVEKHLLATLSISIKTGF